jgi:outer membrane biosynthesis protein TonB
MTTFRQFLKWLRIALVLAGILLFAYFALWGESVWGALIAAGAALFGQLLGVRTTPTPEEAHPRRGTAQPRPTPKPPTPYNPTPPDRYPEAPVQPQQPRLGTPTPPRPPEPVQPPVEPVESTEPTESVKYRARRIRRGPTR